MQKKDFLLILDFRFEFKKQIFGLYLRPIRSKFRCFSNSENSTLSGDSFHLKNITLYRDLVTGYIFEKIIYSMVSEPKNFSFSLELDKHLDNKMSFIDPKSIIFAQERFKKKVVDTIFKKKLNYN